MTELESRAATVRQCIDWLEATRRQFASAAIALGLPPRVRWKSPIRVVTESVKSFYWEDRDACVLVDHHNWQAIDNRVGDTEEERNLAERLVALYDERCAIRGDVLGPSFGEDPVAHVILNVLHTFRSDYLVKLDSLDAPHEERCADLAEALVKFAESDFYDEVAVVAIGGLYGGPYEHKGVRLRPLTENELGWLHVVSVPEWDYYDRTIAHVARGALRHWDAVESMCLEVVSSFPKTEQEHYIQSVRYDQVILALQLLGCDSIGSSRVVLRRRFGPEVGVHTAKVWLGTRVRHHTITHEEFVRVVDLSDRIWSWIGEGGANRKHLAINSFRRAVTDGDSESALVDYITCMEALLLPAVPEGELGMRFRLAAAELLGANSDERKQLYRDAKAIYGARSKVVHGVKSLTTLELGPLVTLARRMASACIVKMIEHGSVSPDELIQRNLARG